MTRHREPIEQGEVPLSGVLAEFRAALRAEIEAASRSPSSAGVPLINGRRIAQIGISLQYVFDIENVLNLPDGAPGDLYVPGREPVAVDVISKEGLSITLGAREDLGPFVPNAWLKSDLTFLMRRLIERIEARAEVPNPVAERVLGEKPPDGKPIRVNAEQLSLNREQGQALASSLGRNITFIWGPPGTGKTYTIGTIAEQLCQAGRSVLLVSHTNIAVDGAVLRIAELLNENEEGKAELRGGKVIRVGEPRDQRVTQWKDLLLDTHVECRLAELAGRRDELNLERKAASEEVTRLTRLLDINEWVREAENDIADMARDLEALHKLESDIDLARAEQRDLEQGAGYWDAAVSAAQVAQSQIAKKKTLDERVGKIAEGRSQAQAKVDQAKRLLDKEEQLLERALALEPLRIRLRALPALEQQTEVVAASRNKATTAREAHEKAAAGLREAERLLHEARSVGRLMRLWRRLPDPQEHQVVVYGLADDERRASKEKEAGLAEREEVERLLLEVSELAKQLEPHTIVPDAGQQRATVQRAADNSQACHRELQIITAALENAKRAQSAVAESLEDFRVKYGAEPPEVLRKAETHAAALKATRERADELVREYAERRRSLDHVLEPRLLVLRQWGLTAEAPDTTGDMFAAVESAYERAAVEVQGIRPEQLGSEREHLNARIIAIESEIQRIEQTLKSVGELVIADAAVVATTLTRAYLWDAIQARRFDTVILDEASMAPIPALWAAAGLADNNAIVVGDFRQLPPIVISEDDLAQKWLGRGIFDVASCSNPGTFPSHVVTLAEQRRMHPQISAIAKEFFYQDILLRDHEKTESDGMLTDWYRADWGYDRPVLLVDTAPMGAWVTGVGRDARRASRLNFLSATVCVELAAKMLRNGRSKWTNGAEARILIICPYRAHANLLHLLLEKEGLLGEVNAGTVHSFQGSEADVVILDLVNDEPHFLVGMFDRRRDETTQPLLNVALTRARRRLIVIGDFEYITKKANKDAFIRRQLIPFLRRKYPSVDAFRVVTAGLAARAAKAQTEAIGGLVEPLADREIVTGTAFDKKLLADLAGAKNRIVLFSQLITERRLGLLAPQLRAAVERVVRVYVVTKAQGERKQKELAHYRMLEQTLTDWGVVVVHKRGMHEKLLFIDHDILWSGSLNCLSYTGKSTEHMERRRNRDVFDHYWKLLRLSELLGEYDSRPPACPVCGNEVVASEGGKRSGMPYYWLCTNPDCNYQRKIDERPLEGGIIRCRNCGGDVEYGEWGGKPHWRCISNRQHRQKVARTHILLPKMRALVPKSGLHNLDRLFGIGRPKKPDDPRRQPGQGHLFNAD